MILSSKTKVHTNTAKGKRVLTDPKFLIGVFLIIISISLTTLLINKARGGQEYYEATKDIPAGQIITLSDLKVISARVDGDAYLRAGQLTENTLTTRTINKGEMLPKAALVKENSQAYRQIVINVTPKIPTSVKVGSKVELWVVPEENGNSPEPNKAQRLSEQVIVYNLPESQNRILTERAQAVEISVPEAELPVILEHANNQHQLVLVPKG
ncbi:SAF domain protein [Gleimia coleocanis DSM 15436]|uniref:SAF domain protein n=1 Tax=Gleimia coleocanis DSM 15436 TaxID=525245 RepID=C0VZW8_9ACTO|nr:SAF domain-containing protein [Gleimia coleocanis]EEH63827.1 SAF domain protein [Gleimia coleocanis DSM 15436]